MPKIDRDTLKAAVRDHAETLCRHYFPAGKRVGNQWVIGNLDGDPGQSLRIELEGEKAGLAYDFASGEGCDLVDAIKQKTGLRFLEAAREISQLTGVNLEEPIAIQYAAGGQQGGRYQNGNSVKPIDWDKDYRLSPDQMDVVCPWRGLSRSYVTWVDEHRYFGCTKDGRWAFPVYCGGKIVSVQIRIEKNDWRYEPKLKELGIPLSPHIVGDLATAEKVFLGESGWDNFAVLDKLGIQHGEPVAGIATRGASNAALVSGVEIKAEAELYAIPQNDDAGRNWLETLAKTLTRQYRVITVPAAFHDVNDWLKTFGKDLGEFVQAILNAEIRKPAPEKQPQPKIYIEFHRPSYFLSYQPPPDLVLAGDNHIVRGGIFVIGGPPGVGKSRSSVALAIAGALRVPWMGLETFVNFKTLILQSENGRLRLQQELAEINEPRLEDYLVVSPPPPFGMCFSKSEFRDQLKEYAEEWGPQLVLIDPWNAVANDDRMKDYREAFDVVLEVFQPSRDNGPSIGILAHTRKPLPGERAVGRALLNLLAGSYILGGTPRCVFVMQSASDDVEETRVVWTCCKNNDGKLGPRLAWERRNGLFVPAKDFDWDEWEHPSDGRSSRRLNGTIDDLLKLVPKEEPISREDLYAKAVGLIARDDMPELIGELLRGGKIFIHKIRTRAKTKPFTGYAQTPPRNDAADMNQESGTDDDIDIEDDPG